MTKQEILQKCTVDGNIIKLPEGQLERKLYTEVASALNLIGGKWVGHKTMGFVFPSDPTELLSQIAGGESRNLKKEFQFFGTPDALADELVAKADIQLHHNVLEPSAGQGAIVKAIHRLDKNKKVECFELMDTNRMILEKIPNAIVTEEDFLKIGPEYLSQYDRIVMNPPFQKNQDISHIQHAFSLLTKGGRLVSVASTHWVSSKNKKETEFRNWLEKVGAVQEEISAGTFKESGTNIATMMIVIDKK